MNEQIGEYAELGDVRAEDLDKDEAEFLRVCETRVKDGDGKLKVSEAEEHNLIMFSYGSKRLWM